MKFMCLLMERSVISCRSFDVFSDTRTDAQFCQTEVHHESDDKREQARRVICLDPCSWAPGNIPTVGSGAFDWVSMPEIWFDEVFMLAIVYGKRISQKYG